MTEYETRTTRVTIAHKGEAIFSERATDITIEDEAAGEYVNVLQKHGAHEIDTIVIDPEENSEMWKANMRLIAAAPEMLEFCKRVAYRYQVFCNGLVSPEMYVDYREAMALIRKATGDE